MKKSWGLLLIIIISLVLIIGIIMAIYYRSDTSRLIFKDQSTELTLSPEPTKTVADSDQELPVSEFTERITKKSFGQYITPENSPIADEQFTGYHTGVDVEYEDVAEEVPVYAIDAGDVIYSGIVNGYGGFVAIKHPNYISVYGHLKPTSLPSINTHLDRGEQIGILGEGDTEETDFERKHLHFGILNKTVVDFRGYVTDQTELELWQNPVEFLANK